MIRRLAFAVAAVLALALAGCGGGDSPPPPVTSTQAFPVQKAWISSLTIPDQKSFSLSGSGQWASSTVTSGSGTATWGALTAATFEGKAALSTTMTEVGSLTQPNYFVIPFTHAPSTLYVDGNYVPVGMVVGAMYFVTTSAPALPASAKVGDTGVVATYARYSDVFKSERVGTRTVSWSLQADTDTTAILALGTTDYDASNAISATDTLYARITTTGGYTRIAQRISAPDATLLNLTLY